MIKTKYNLFQLFISLFFSCFFIAISIFLLTKNESSNSVSTKQLIAPLILISTGLYLPYLFFERSPRVTFDDNYITVKYFVNSKVYSWEDVKEIHISKKEYFPMLIIFGQEIEAIVLIFANSEKLILWNDMYRSMDTLRNYFNQKHSTKIKGQKAKLSDKYLQLLTSKQYSGNPWTSLNSLIVIGMFLFFMYNFFNKHPKNIYGFLFFIIVLFPFYFFFGTQMHYFIIAGEKLIIKNHFFPWKNKVYELNSIREMAVESPHKRSNTLRIITNEFNSKTFGAGSLRDKHWRELRDDMKNIGIPFRADTYIG